MRKLKNFVLTSYLKEIDFLSLCLSTNLQDADPHIDIKLFKDAFF